MGRADWMENNWDDDGATLAMGRWIAREKSVTNGRPAYEALKEFRTVLLNMEHKRLITGSLCDGTGVCAIGAWVYQQYRDQGMQPKQAWKKLKSQAGIADEGTYEQWDATLSVGSDVLAITKTLAEMISYQNDDEFRIVNNKFVTLTEELRHKRMLDWVERKIRNSPHFEGAHVLC